MTLICSSKDVDKLISEMRHWGPDPDLQRIADALPIELLETAYIAKLDALPPEPIPEQAGTARQKIALLRTVFSVWLRHPKWLLGQLITNTVFAGQSRELSLFQIKDESFARSCARALSYTPDE